MYLAVQTASAQKPPNFTYGKFWPEKSQEESEHDLWSLFGPSVRPFRKFPSTSRDVFETFGFGPLDSLFLVDGTLTQVVSLQLHEFYNTAFWGPSFFGGCAEGRVCARWFPNGGSSFVGGGGGGRIPTAPLLPRFNPLLPRFNPLFTSLELLLNVIAYLNLTSAWTGISVTTV